MSSQYKCTLVKPVFTAHPQSREWISLLLILLMMDGSARAIIIMYLNIEYLLPDFKTNTDQFMKSQFCINAYTCTGKDDYYHEHVTENQFCLINFEQISTSYLKSNVPGSSKWKAVCLGTCACVPDICRTGLSSGGTI